MPRRSLILVLLLLSFCLPMTPAAAEAPRRVESAPPRAAAEVASLVGARDVEGLKAKGPTVMPLLVELYRRSDLAGRANVAWIFYQLSWQSEAAKEAMMADVHTEDRNLRLQVQWALGRVSSDDAVVDVLLDNLQHDKNPLFRDKAACGIASDQIHLSDRQKVRLYQRLILLLESPNIETRRLAIQVLEVHTGQRKDFIAAAPEHQRAGAIAIWRRWLTEFEASVS